MKYIKTYEEIEDKSLITVLDLSNKTLKKLPDLSEYTNLKTFFCQNNKLTKLPELPKSLRYLSCHHNQLTLLPELPKSLQYLHCYNNNLTELPELPKSLKILYCTNNKLSYDNLKEYKEWYAKKYPERVDAEKYNL